MSNENKFAAMAHTYSDTGWAVFPCWWVESGECACPRGSSCNSPGKHPLFAPAHTPHSPERTTCKGECGQVGHGLYDATRDPKILTEWWDGYPLANIGLPADANGLAVLDIDPPKGGAQSFTKLCDYMLSKGVDLTKTLRQRTGSGGVHYVFTAPEGGAKGGANVFGVDMPGLDVRGRGGYIVAPPSTHASGGTYEWDDFFADIAPWPKLLSRLLDPPKPAPAPYKGPSKPPSDKYAAAALDREVLAVRDAYTGTRNDTLNRAAFSLGQLISAGLLDEPMVRIELRNAALAAGLGESEAVATILSGLRQGKANPRKVRP